jgi:hypothetical protein
MNSTTKLSFIEPELSFELVENNGSLRSVSIFSITWCRHGYLPNAVVWKRCMLSLLSLKLISRRQWLSYVPNSSTTHGEHSMYEGRPSNQLRETARVKVAISRCFRTILAGKNRYGARSSRNAS